ncbi:MAG TPA: nucleotidyl transferase AbiEii/AbiGii toxin family protein, partial [Burkholderiaceae bacterium]|nr:nucleotidyl transferase AbiEii/AbiGii toxin family protein [Burkholderiaceae bacterium]
MRSLAEWVGAETDPIRGLIREGMHAAMLATARLDGRFPAMVMKGGVLMAVRYGSTRYTTDVDYSTTARLDDVDVAMFVGDLAAQLQRIADVLDYDMACRIQGHRINPPRPEATFPTLQVKIGVARLSKAPELRRLHAGMAPHTFSIDYSFNEWPAATEVIAVDQGAPIQAYDLTDLIAEKYRSLLQ